MRRKAEEESDSSAIGDDDNAAGATWAPKTGNTTSFTGH
jgi:hypothetical protein